MELIVALLVLAFFAIVPFCVLFVILSLVFGPGSVKTDGKMSPQGLGQLVS